MTPESLIYKACEENGITPAMFFGVRRTEEISNVRKIVCKKLKIKGMNNSDIARTVGLDVTSVRWLLGEYSLQQKEQRLKRAKKHYEHSCNRRKDGDLDGE